MKRRHTAEDLQDAVRAHYRANKRVWREAIVTGKLAMQAKGVERRTRRALAGLGDMTLAIEKVTPGEDEASVRLLIEVGKGPPVPLLFGIVGDDGGKPEWGVLPDIEDPTDLKAARKARSISSAH